MKTIFLYTLSAIWMILALTNEREPDTFLVIASVFLAAGILSIGDKS